MATEKNLGRKNRRASIEVTRGFFYIVLIYLWLKALFVPTFNLYDVFLATMVDTELTLDYGWLKAIAGIGLGARYTFLPEARADILFDLGILL